MIKILIKITILAMLGLITLNAFAHHAFNSIYDVNNFSVINGTIEKVMWKNPHAQLTITTDSGDSWHIETNSISILKRMGVDDNLLLVGDRISIAGYKRRDGKLSMWTNNILLSNDQEVILRPGIESFWNDSALSSSESWLSNGDTGGEEQGIFRVWSTRFNGPGRYMRLPNPPLTESALVKYNSYNPLVDDPTLNCNPKGMPWIMHQPYPTEFRQGENKIYFHIEEYDLIRVIHMEQNIEAKERTLLGHSTGKWDGDDLLVETTHVNWHQFDNTGIPISDNATFEERFSLSSDGSELNYTIKTTDLLTFNEVIIQNKQFVWREDVTIDPYICTNYDG